LLIARLFWERLELIDGEVLLILVCSGVLGINGVDVLLFIELSMRYLLVVILLVLMMGEVAIFLELLSI
jgi:hypothetical protein